MASGKLQGISDGTVEVEKPSDRQLGKYELIRRIAKGGMAEIFLAKTQGIANFEKLVVLKRILPQHAVDRRFIEMFLQEARLAATLHHTNIAQVYDIGRSDSTYFFTMEYIRGIDLRRAEKAMAIADSVMPLEHAITIALGVTAGVHYAHEKRAPNGELVGIVHRDISPSNVLVGFDGGVKVVDFGIAKATSLRGETQLQGVKGKIAYMSPEQCQDRPLDRRSDIFSIGTLLYELTTGRRLYVEGSDFELMQKIVGEDVVPPSTHVPGYPPELERIVLRALRRDRNERYPTAEALQLEIEQFVQSSKLLVSTAALGRYVQALVGEQGHEEASFGEEAGLFEVAPVDVVTMSLPEHDKDVPGPGEGATQRLGDPTGLVDALKPPPEAAPNDAPVAQQPDAPSASLFRPSRRRGIALGLGGLTLALAALLLPGWRSQDTGSTVQPAPFTRANISPVPVNEVTTPSTSRETLGEDSAEGKIGPEAGPEVVAQGSKKIEPGGHRALSSRKTAAKQRPRKNTQRPVKAGIMPNDRNSFYLPD